MMWFLGYSGMGTLLGPTLFTFNENQLRFLRKSTILNQSMWKCPGTFSLLEDFESGNFHAMLPLQQRKILIYQSCLWYCPYIMKQESFLSNGFLWINVSLTMCRTLRTWQQWAVPTRPSCTPIPPTPKHPLPVNPLPPPNPTRHLYASSAVGNPTGEPHRGALRLHGTPVPAAWAPLGRTATMPTLHLAPPPSTRLPIMPSTRPAPSTMDLAWRRIMVVGKEEAEEGLDHMGDLSTPTPKGGARDPKCSAPPAKRNVTTVVVVGVDTTLPVAMLVIVIATQQGERGHKMAVPPGDDRWWRGSEEDCSSHRACLLIIVQLCPLMSGKSPVHPSVLELPEQIDLVCSEVYFMSHWLKCEHQGTMTVYVYCTATRGPA